MRSKGTWITFVVTAMLAVSVVPLDVAGAGTGTGVDRNGNKIFDSLDGELARAGARDKVDVIAVFSEGSSSARAEAARDDVGPFRTTYEYESLPAFAAQMTPDQVRALARRPDVVHLQADSPVELALDTAKAAVGADRAAADFAVDGNNESSTLCPGVKQYCKDDVVVAVLDSGVDVNHVDLDNGKILGGTDCSSGTCGGSGWMIDTNGHGTHVSSIVAGEGDGNPAMRGLAPGAALVSVKVGSTGSTVSALDASLEWVLANQATYGIEVVNMSLNGKVPSDGTDTTSRLANRLAAAGVTTFAAMGNGAPDPGGVSFPAAAKYAVGVGNMSDPGDSGGEPPGFGLWWTSKRGPTADGRIKPDLLSYGVDITAASANTSTGYKTMSGTSQASPFAAGVAALMLDANPSMVARGTACSPDDLSPDCADGVLDATMAVPVKDEMMRTAVDWARPGLDSETGAGRLDAYAAVDAAAPAEGRPAPALTHEFYSGTLPDGGSADHTITLDRTTAPIAATVIMTDRAPGATSPDFNLALIGPAGDQLAYSAAASNLRQETIGYQPATTGSYKVRVSAAAGSGSYWLDVSYPGAPPATPSPTPSPSPSPTPTPTPVPTAAPTPPPLPIPLPPIGVSAQPVAGSNSQIDLTWSDVASEAGYRIERSANGSTGWAVVGSTPADVVTYRDSGLAPSTTYYYRVKAFNASGESSPSSSVSARTNGDVTAPTVPTMVKASATRGKVTITWKASTDSGGSGLAGYKVYRSTSSTGAFTEVGTTTSLSYADAAVVKNTTYYYYVVAYDKAGNVSAASAKVSGKPT